MKNGTKCYLVVALLTMLLGLIGQTTGPLALTASAANAPASPQNLVVGVQTFGATYGAWSARWWQWLLSIPSAVNPNLDPTGANCDRGQKDNEDDVWFLAGTFGGDVTRTCTIPAGKPIFFPLINSVAFKPTGGETLLDLRRMNAAFINTVSVLTCTIDGVALKDLFNFRFRSPSFSVNPPLGALLQPSATDPMVSDGYWLLLSPLPAGGHLIEIHAETTGGFSLEVTYNLTIAP